MVDLSISLEPTRNFVKPNSKEGKSILAANGSIVMWPKGFCACGPLGCGLGFSKGNPPSFVSKKILAGMPSRKKPRNALNAKLRLSYPLPSDAGVQTWSPIWEISTSALHKEHFMVEKRLLSLRLAIFIVVR